MTIRTLMISVVALGLAGCASRGNEVLKSQSVASVDLTVVDGRTTRQEVQAIYGAPAQISFLNEKNEIWTYRWARATAQGQNFIPIIGPFVRGYDTRKKELVIVFNEQSIVARHSMIDVNDTVRTGLLDKGDAPTGAVSPSPAPPPAVAPASTPAAGGPVSNAPAATSPVQGQSRSRL
jgi:hypothetical protein